MPYRAILDDAGDPVRPSLERRAFPLPNPPTEVGGCFSSNLQGQLRPGHRIPPTGVGGCFKSSLLPTRRSLPYNRLMTHLFPYKALLLNSRRIAKLADPNPTAWQLF